MKKAQIAVETMLYVSFFMLLLAFLTFYLLSNFNSEIQKKQYLLLRNLGEQIAAKFLFVINSAPPTYYSFSLPNLNYFSYNYELILSNTNGMLYFIAKEGNIKKTYFSYPLGFRNFACSQKQVAVNCCSIYTNIDTNIVVDLKEVKKINLNLTYSNNQNKIEVGCST